MLRCEICGDASPNDARFCIGCGKPVGINPYYGATHRLETIRAGAYVGDPNIYEIPYGVHVEQGTGYQKPSPFLQPDKPEELYFIYRADLGAILKDTSTYVRSTDEGYEIYYKGRKVVFMD
jgi:hypothetical protein